LSMGSWDWAWAPGSAIRAMLSSGWVMLICLPETFRHLRRAWCCKPWFQHYLRYLWVFVPVMAAEPSG
jgi:hypothetical protein